MKFLSPALVVALLFASSGFASIRTGSSLPSAFPAELAIEVPASEARPFILANRTGTYYYGCTNERGWDSGWMGLWINRKRVIAIRPEPPPTKTAIQPLRFSDARCTVTPFEVRWRWPNIPEILRLSFRENSDSVHWTWTTASAETRSDLFLPELHQCFFACDDPLYTQAVAWAHLHLLYLLAEGDSLLYAGIPWFNEGWGRDTFISLPGLLVTGHTDIARKLLVRFAGWIDRDPQSPTYGRVPNRVRPSEEIVYNTADGTPWWILGAYYYGLYAGDYDLWKLLLASEDSSNAAANTVHMAIDGAIARSDSLGFLTHSDADTWMDAVGPDGPETPRGNRAVEVQALHFASLEAALRMAAVAEGKIPHATITRWRDCRDRLRRNFLSHYLAATHGGLFDRLHPDGTPDFQFRPNQLFATTVSLPLEPLLPPDISRQVTRAVCRNLIHPYGVLSLSPDDDRFHPFHLDELYPKDHAYHNGIVWTWLSGPAKTALVQEGRGDLAIQLAEYEAGLILHRGCAGSLPEVTDALPRKGRKEVALSGTVSQAWSLAEFLRTTYQDFLGLRPVQVPGRIEPFWFFDPRLPEEWGEVTVRVTLEQTPVLVRMRHNGDTTRLTLSPEIKPAFPIGIKAFDLKNGITGVLNDLGDVHLLYDHRRGIAYADQTPTAQVKLSGWPYDSGPPEITLAPPLKIRDWPALRPPPWDILTAKEVQRLPDSKEPVWVAEDSLFDDDGGCGFTYPLDEHFSAGILDIVRAEIRSDRQSYHFLLTFRNLVQPGWHPEYGFQLTYAAICLHTPDANRASVGANSQYIFPDSNRCSRIIYVGGGLRMEDDRGRVLATFTPRTLNHAIGDTALRIIRFSLPRKYFPASARFGSWTIFIGSQDDHGGAGLGEFRTVKPVAEQWAGGGNLHAAPNIYDELYVPPLSQQRSLSRRLKE